MKTNLRNLIESHDNLLFQVPALIKISKMVYEDLPVGHPGRKAIRNIIQQQRKDLMRLDVVCQDLESGICQREVNQIYNKQKSE